MAPAGEDVGLPFHSRASSSGSRPSSSVHRGSAAEEPSREVFWLRDCWRGGGYLWPLNCPACPLPPPPPPSCSVLPRQVTHLLPILFLARCSGCVVEPGISPCLPARPVALPAWLCVVGLSSLTALRCSLPESRLFVSPGLGGGAL